MTFLGNSRKRREKKLQIHDICPDSMTGGSIHGILLAEGMAMKQMKFTDIE
jgi:hypothetical protein